jgi:dipeptidyl aminopeptidase/acylaminoacyl peptidase
VSYAISRSGSTFVYAAERPEANAIDEKVLRQGFHVASESLSDLVRGKLYNSEPELFLRGNAAGAERRLPTRNPFDSGVNDLFLSPDGRYLLLKTDSTDMPPRWSQYVDESIQAVVRRKPTKGFPTGILQFELIDTETGQSEDLLDAPATYSSSDVLWSPDSQSVLLCGTYLPLDGVDSTELRTRQGSRFVVEIKLRGRQVVTVTNEDLTPVRWDPRTNVVQFRAESNQGQAGGVPDLVRYKTDRGVWKRVPSIAGSANDVQPEILVDQDLNVAPQVVAVDPATNRRALLLDLNPQFAGLAFGKVEEIHWMDSVGRPVIGGLYLPPDYVAGKRYPLVIQTHGFRPHEFWIDGAHTTVFAAQALASTGIVVLQVNDIFYDSLDTPQEPERAMAVYENAVKYLDRQGIIDPNHVGLVGFSRTCLYVKYALTHSSLHFQAAIVADGFDVGYWQYLLHNQAIWTSEIESVVGVAPFGDGLSVWRKRSPGFLLDRVQTPLQIQALSPSSLLGEWDWFSGLKKLHKPVDLVYLPDGTHILVKPWERTVSQDGSVDWFRFWLKGEEDPNPAKKQQFVRWRELRRQVAEIPSQQM